MIDSRMGAFEAVVLADDARCLGFIEAALAFDGWRVQGCTGMSDAICSSAHASPDLIICQAQVPDATLTALLGELRSAAPRGLLGRPGDGPGELRVPIALVVRQDQDLLVIDKRMRLTLFDSTGGYIDRIQLQGIGASGIVATAGEYVVMAKLLSRGRDSLSLAQRYSPTGELLAAINRVSAPRGTSANFAVAMGAVAGDYVVSLSGISDSAICHHRQSGREWAVPAHGQLHPGREYPPPDLSTSELTKWAYNYAWPRAVCSSTDGVAIAALARYDPDADVSEVQYLEINCPALTVSPVARGGYVADALAGGEGFVIGPDAEGRLVLRSLFYSREANR